MEDIEENVGLYPWEGTSFEMPMGCQRGHQGHE